MYEWKLYKVIGTKCSYLDRVTAERHHTAVLSLAAGSGGTELELSRLLGGGLAVRLGGLHHDLELGRAGGPLALELDRHGPVGDDLLVGRRELVLSTLRGQAGVGEVVGAGVVDLERVELAVLAHVGLDHGDLDLGPEPRTHNPLAVQVGQVEVVRIVGRGEF